jgi:hypothetical protein
LGFPYCLFSQVLQKENGIVEFVFEQDSSLQKYWVKRVIITVDETVYFLVPNAMSVAVKLNVLCGGKDSILNYSKKEKLKYFFDLKQFQDTTQLDIDDNYHRGGDIYRYNKNTIGIVFHLTSYFVMLKETPCEDFFYGKLYKCPIEYDKSFYPMAIMIGTIKSRSLSKRERKKYHIKRFESKSFEKGYCD